MAEITINAGFSLEASGKQRRFSILAYNGGTLRVGGFSLPVVVDLKGLSVPGSIPILIDHQANVEATLGVTDSITNDGRTLHLTGIVTGQSYKSQQVLSQHDAGHRWQSSIGALITETQEIQAGQSVIVNGQTFTGPVIVATRSQLRETSVLPMGADNSTTVNLAASAANLSKGKTMTFEEFTASLGVDTSTLTESGSKVLQAQFAATQTGTENSDLEANAVTSLRAAVSLDLRRQGEIQAVCAGYPHIAATAIEQNWSPEKAENHVLKAKSIRNAPSNWAGSSSSSVSMDKSVLTASLMLNAGRESAALKAYGEATCERARAAKIGTFKELAAQALSLSGHDPRSFQSDSKMLQAAFSSSSLPTILSDSAAKTLEMAYAETTNDWRLFCNVSSAANFHPQSSIRPSAIESLEPLGKGSKIKHGSIGEEDVYEWRVSTFARMLQVTREDIVNDDLRFLDELSPMLGQAAGRALKDLIWGTILAGQAEGFFATGNGNLAEASSALDVGTLGAAVASMRKQRDSQGNDIDIRPSVLVVSPSLELTAKALLNSSEIVTISEGVQPNGNPVRNIVPHLIVESRLENSVRFEGTSSTQWYLFGAPETRPCTVGFLNNQQRPTIDIEEADFSTLGVQMRCYHDFGFALSDSKSAYKATGAAGEGG